jgi:hypothetical protein
MVRLLTSGNQGIDTGKPQFETRVTCHVAQGIEVN